MRVKAPLSFFEIFPRWGIPFSMYEIQIHGEQFNFHGMKIQSTTGNAIFMAWISDCTWGKCFKKVERFHDVGSVRKNL